MISDNDFIDRKYHKYIPILAERLNKINDMNAKEYLSYCDGALYLSNEYCKSLDIKKLKESFTRVMR